MPLVRHAIKIVSVIDTTIFRTAGCLQEEASHGAKDGQPKRADDKIKSAPPASFLRKHSAEDRYGFRRLSALARCQRIGSRKFE
jgi:hypothetical protein